MITAAPRFRLSLSLALTIAACSSNRDGAEDTPFHTDAARDPSLGDGGTMGGDDPQGEGGAASPDAQRPVVPVVVGEVDPNAPANTGLPDLARLTNVRAEAVGDRVSIYFDPAEGAADYRVYALPKASDVTATDDGHVVIRNAVYRCAGDRQAPAVTMDGAEQVQSGAIKTLVDGQDVVGYRRSLAEAKLGYVYPEAGPGLVPVYALGEPQPRADNHSCNSMRWNATRRKQYVTSDATRTQLLAQGFRDDGIAFYVPADGAAGSQPVLTTTDDSDYGARLYFVAGPESAKRSNPTAAFAVLTASADKALPLMRVHYTNVCGQAHDELVAGTPRFELARRQGDQLPVTRLHWAGLTESTILVVEALDEGCPWNGMLAPVAAPARTDPAYGANYPAWITPEDAQKASSTGEVFINGQHDGTNPRPIARSFVKIGPAPEPDLDWSFGFTASDTLGTFAATPGQPVNCAEVARAKTDTADSVFYCAENDRSGQRNMYGEWWVMFTDLAADTNGKYRLTPEAKAEMDDSSFLYASMDVDSFSTLRRYPQILISDQDIPVQNNLPSGNTLVLQTFEGWPNTYELQVCDHKNWDVNDQCPKFDFYRQYDQSDASKVVKLAPVIEISEQIGMDFSNRYEIYVSTKRAYIFFDGHPYGCAILPNKGVPSGAVTVTFGTVLYHSGVDYTFDFTGKKLQTVSQRHFDNLGFKSHVGAPAWDEARFPCTSRIR